VSKLALASGRGGRLSLSDPSKHWHTKQFRHFLDLTGVRYAKGSVYLPADPRLVELLQAIDPTVELASDAKRWYDGVVAREVRFAATAREPAPPVCHPLLWNFQHTGVNFLLAKRRSLLCDDPGLGKTATAIVAIEASKRNRRVLIVCPKSLKEWWRSEINRWTQSTPKPWITVIESSIREWQIDQYFKRWGYCIVHWEQLRLIPELQRPIWQWVICDEAHRTKNRKTQIFAALKHIQSSHMALLTGTPFANNPSELWALLHLIEPQKYTSFWRFFSMYVDYHDGYWGREILGVRNAALLRRELSSRMLRRTKTECLPDLPEKVYKVVPLWMTPRQQTMYRDMAREMLVELEGGEELEAPNVVAMITRLRQIVSTTATLEASDHSSKLDAVLDLVKDTNEKLVVFTQFRKTVAALCSRLRLKDIPFTFIWGGLSSLEVHRRVKDFQEGEPRVFVATAQTGGVGLTLTASRTVVFIDQHWNPAKQIQAEDRVHRIGQTNSVQIVVLHCPKTVDDIVEGVLKRKLAMIAEILQPELVKHLKEVVK